MFLTSSQTLWIRNSGGGSQQIFVILRLKFENHCLSQFIVPFFENIFHTFTLLKLPATPSPSPLPPDDHFYFNVNRKQKYSEENFLIFLHPHLLASTGAPGPCLPHCCWGQPPSPPAHYIPSLPSPGVVFSSPRGLSHHHTMSLSQRQNKSKPLKISRSCCGAVNHIVMWNFWIFICIFLFS